MTRRPLVAALLALVARANAAEGSWQPDELPAIADTLHAAGLAVDPRELADPQRYPLNAVVELGDHCTATLVSPFGLMIGDRRCVLDALRAHSTDGRDLVRDGLLARTLGEELPGAPGVRLTVSVQDVSAQILAGARVQDPGARAEAIELRKERLLAACAVPGHRCRIHALPDGGGYRLIKQLQIADVRVAYVPPEVGGEAADALDGDGPGRHRADFALLRAYVGPDGWPADASELNVPLRPPSHMKLQPAGLAAGDFAMALGYSGSLEGGNGTLRFSFGKVGGVVPAAGDGGPPVNLLADFDVASDPGSPLLNARAELVGIVFDGQPETNAAGSPFDASLARSVAVDIRQVLRLLEGADDGGRLLQELVVVPAVVDARR